MLLHEAWHEITDYEITKWITSKVIVWKEKEECLVVLPGLKEFKFSLLYFIIFSFTFFKYIPNLKFDEGWDFFS